MKITKIRFGHRVTPSTELPRDFCAGIGPLPLGVVLVFVIFIIFVFENAKNSTDSYMSVQK